jgi:hypothetical protein
MIDCCEQFTKLVEQKYIDSHDEYYTFMIVRRKGGGAEVKIRFCPFCGEGEIRPGDRDFFDAQLS